MDTQVPYTAVRHPVRDTHSDEATRRIADAGALLAIGIAGMPAVVGLTAWAFIVALGDIGLDNEPLRTIAAAGGTVAIVGAVALIPAAIVGRRWAPKVALAGSLGVGRALAMSATAVLLGDVLIAGVISLVVLLSGGGLDAFLLFAYGVGVGGAVIGGPAFLLGLVAIYVWSRLLPRAIRRTARP